MKDKEEKSLNFNEVIKIGGDKMEYYMLRMMNHENGFGRKLFENGYAAIGYRDFDKQNNFEFIEKYKKTQDKEKILKDNIKKAWNGKTIGSHWKLDKFFNFKMGDVLLIPDHGCFYLVRVVSDIMSFDKIKKDFCKENENLDIGFVYKIEKIFNKGISRNDFAGSRLTSRLKSISALLNISDLKDEIEEAKTSFEKNEPINLNQSIKDKLTNELLDQLKKNLNPNKFEKLLTKLMYKLGATTVDIPAKNDKSNTTIGIGDVDVVAVFEKLKHIIYIQAKFHKGETRMWALEQLNDYNDIEKEEEGYTQSFWAITTADTFSQEAIDLSNLKDSKSIRLIDGQELGKLILDAGIEGL